jgi:hypothetical protein
MCHPLANGRPPLTRRFNHDAANSDRRCRGTQRERQNLSARPTLCSWMMVSKSYFRLRGNAMNPSRFGILTFGNVCASSTSSFPMMSLSWRI